LTGDEIATLLPVREAAPVTVDGLLGRETNADPFLGQRGAVYDRSSLAKFTPSAALRPW
jgi:hypothetical protein